MACKECEDAHELQAYYPFRVGNKEIGYGTVLVVACQNHAKLVMERLLENDDNRS